MTTRTLYELMATLPQEGEIVWIGVRPARKVPMISVPSVELTPDSGIEGDRNSSTGGKRQVTLIQSEH